MLVTSFASFGLVLLTGLAFGIGFAIGTAVVGVLLKPR